MSLGHMTPQEQLITLGGTALVILATLYAAENFGETIAIVALVGGLFLVFVLKAWCWSHTVYEGGFSNPKWSSEPKGIGKEDFRDE